MHASNAILLKGVYRICSFFLFVFVFVFFFCFFFGGGQCFLQQAVGGTLSNPSKGGLVQFISSSCTATDGNACWINLLRLVCAQAILIQNSY